MCLNFSFTQNGPTIPSESKAFVHHIIIYLCQNGTFDHAYVETGAPCIDAGISVQLGRGSTILAAWAVGGDISTC